MRSLFFWTAFALLLPQALVTRRRDVSVVAQIARAPAAREGRPVRWSAVTAIVAVVGVPPLGGFPLLPQPLRSLFEMRDFRDGLRVSRRIGTPGRAPLPVAEAGTRRVQPPAKTLGDRAESDG